MVFCRPLSIAANLGLCYSQAIAKDVADKLSVATAAERAQQAQQQAASADALRQVRGFGECSWSP
jgi:hypothetical protein